MPDVPDDDTEVFSRPVSEEIPECLIGSVIDGKYEVLGLLGEGSIGKVYRARNHRIWREVALKVLRPVFGDDPKMMNRFLREARATARVDHPNVVKVWDVGVENGDMPFIVMELIEGETLATRIARQKRLPINDVFSIGRQLLAGLAAAHAVGVVHRDVKPENIILSDGHVRILDFGIARLVKDENTAITQTGELLGTPSYLSPEQARGTAIDHRADAWAATVVFYEMLTGERPFDSGSLIGTLSNVISKPHPVPSSLRSDSLPGFDALIDAGLDKDVSGRADIAALLARLEAIEGDLAKEDLRATQRRPSFPDGVPLGRNPDLDQTTVDAGATSDVDG